MYIFYIAIIIGAALTYVRLTIVYIIIILLFLSL